MKHFSKILAITVIAVLVSANAFAGVGGYVFSATSVPYTPLGGGTTTIFTGVNDDVLSGVFPIGFPFVYDGITYTSFKANSNGFIILNTAFSAGASYGPLASNGLVIAPLWDDAQVSATGQVHYIVTGTVGTQVLTLEYKAMQYQYNNPTPNAEFQVKLFEADGHIEFSYGVISPSAPPSAAPSSSIGISDFLANSTTADLNRGHFLSVTPTGPGTATVSSLVENTGVSDAAAPFLTGTTYSFTPPPRISADRTVGAGGNFTTLQSAFAALRDSGVSAPINLTLLAGFTLVSDTARLDYIPGSSAINTVTVKPDVGAAITLTRASVAATASDYTIRVRGARFVTIDGLNTGGSSLTIANTGTAISTTAIRAFDGLQNCTFKNLTVTSEGGSAGTTNAAIFFQSPNTNNAINIPNSNNTVQSCVITGTSTALRPQNGILFSGSSTVISDGCKVQNCIIRDYIQQAQTTTNGGGIQGIAGYSNLEISGNEI